LFKQDVAQKTFDVARAFPVKSKAVDVTKLFQAFSDILLGWKYRAVKKLLILKITSFCLITSFHSTSGLRAIPSFH